MKRKPNHAAKLFVKPLCVHPSGCRSRSNTLKRGPQTAALRLMSPRLVHNSTRKFAVDRTKFRQVLDCGDGVFGVAALDRGGSVGDERRSLERSRSQSGDFADSVTALAHTAACHGRSKIYNKNESGMRSTPTCTKDLSNRKSKLGSTALRLRPSLLAVVCAVVAFFEPEVLHPLRAQSYSFTSVFGFGGLSDGLAATAHFYAKGIAVDRAGNIYIGD